MENFDSRDKSDVALDRLLASARFPEASPAAARRLRDAWTELRAPKPIPLFKIGAWSVAAAAAVLLIAVGTWRRLPHRSDAGGERALMMSNSPSNDEMRVITPLVPQPVWRAATVGERLVIQSAAARSERTPRPATSKQMFQQVREALAVVTKDPSSTAPVAASLARNVGAARASRRLAELAQSKLTPQRLAAVRLLSELGDAGALPVLLQLSRDPALRDAAMPGVIRLSDSTALASLFQDESDPSVKHQILQSMLSRGHGVDLYLPLVIRPQTREQALAMVHAMPNPPVDALIGALDSPRVDARFAAARALAEVCSHAGAGATLRRMVEQNDHRREALAALMLCRDPSAASYLSNARGNRSIDAEIRSLQTQLSNLF